MFDPRARLGQSRVPQTQHHPLGQTPIYQQNVGLKSSPPESIKRSLSRLMGVDCRVVGESDNDVQSSEDEGDEEYEGDEGDEEDEQAFHIAYAPRGVREN